MAVLFKDGNRSIEERNPNEFGLCENGIPVIRLKPPIKEGQCSCFEEFEGKHIIVGIKKGTRGKIDKCDNYIECYKKYKCPKQIPGENRVS